eukprot:TRINITY_DN106370_c0_g1_i1.p1 TRINITY_DN106370_c0_g1~~TRINITY_DN106370_c0_g1_i1.p1  ORF type:complete len:1066 (-),score=241.87 TRINITY_DN106370_c0_g1_i1:173-3370(-)
MVTRQRLQQLWLLVLLLQHVFAQPGVGDVRRDAAARKKLLKEVQTRGAMVKQNIPEGLFGGDLLDRLTDMADVSLHTLANDLDITPHSGTGRIASSGKLDLPSVSSTAHSRDLAEARNSVAVGLMENHRYQEAVVELSDAVLLSSDRPELHYNLGTALSGLSRHAEAEIAYESALQLQPHFPSARFNLARTHMSLANAWMADGDFWNLQRREMRLRSAAKHLELSIDASTSNRSRKETYKAMEEVLYQLGDTEGSWRAYQQFVEMAPNEGLQRRARDDCKRLSTWLEDRLLELALELDLSSSNKLKIRYPGLPASFQEELCNVHANSTGSIHDKSDDGTKLRRQFQQTGHAALARKDVPWSDEAISLFAAYFRSVHKAGGFYKDSKSDPSKLLSGTRWSLDGDRLAAFIADGMRPLAEEAAGKALKLGFAKVAIYEPGAELRPHHDQILNEVSVTLVLQSTERGASSQHWPLVLLRPPKGSRDGSNVSLFAPVGEGLVFLGRDFLHSRPCCLEGGESSLVLLLHYVQDDFPEFHCQTLVNVTGVSAEELLQHRCDRIQDMDSLAVEHQSADTCDGGACHVRGGPRESARSEVRAAGEDRSRRYMLYNPCAINFDPGWCQSQFNNQVFFFLHALSVAEALGRTLVLPPFMWLEHQMAEKQHWYPFEHFFDVGKLKERFDVIRLEDFLEHHELQQPQGKLLWWYYYPPYFVQDQPLAYQGTFFRSYMNLSFAMPKRMSPFWEVRMAASGRADVPYKEGEGKSYWMTARLLMGKLRSESSAFHAPPPTSALAWVGFSSQKQRLGGGEEEAALVNAQSREIEMTQTNIGALNLDRNTQPLENASRYEEEALKASHGRPVADIDVVVFDFAPSYNFKYDQFDFDWELRRNRRALSFKADLVRAADAAVEELFQNQPFVALHLRKDGYEHFCQQEERRAAEGRAKLRWGFKVTRQLCNPSQADVLKALEVAGLAQCPFLFLATNGRNQEELDSLQEAVQQRFGARTRRFPAGLAAPEHLPAIDMLIAARGAAFVGNAVSSFSVNILMERDLRGLPRNSSVFPGVTSTAHGF